MTQLIETSTLKPLLADVENSQRAEHLLLKWGDVPHDLAWSPGSDQEPDAQQFMQTHLRGSAILATGNHRAALAVLMKPNLAAVRDSSDRTHEMAYSGEYMMRLLRGSLDTDDITWYTAAATAKQTASMQQSLAQRRQQSRPKFDPLRYAQSLAIRFKPFWARMINQALADCRGHADHLIKTGAYHSTTLNSRLRVAEHLRQSSKRLSRGQDITAEMTRVFYNAMLVTAHELAPQGSLHLGYGVDRDDYGWPDDDDAEYINRVPIGQGCVVTATHSQPLENLIKLLKTDPNTVIARILGHAKQELLHL